MPLYDSPTDPLFDGNLVLSTDPIRCHECSKEHDGEIYTKISKSSDPFFVLCGDCTDCYPIRLDGSRLEKQTITAEPVQCSLCNTVCKNLHETNYLIQRNAFTTQDQRVELIVCSNCLASHSTSCAGCHSVLTNADFDLCGTSVCLLCHS